MDINKSIASRPLCLILLFLFIEQTFLVIKDMYCGLALVIITELLTISLIREHTLVVMSYYAFETNLNT